MLPLVSVVIPHLNNEIRLKACLNALMGQTYTKESLEIIVVDNGSDLDAGIVVEGFKDVRLLVEKSVKSPYACRNKGIEAAKGMIVILLDANCLPDPRFIEKGVSRLLSAGSDVAEGNLKVTLSENYDPWEIADMHYTYGGQTGNSININKTCFRVAGLFFWKYVTDKTGLFIPNIRSLGDMEWSARVLADGFRLGYEGEAVCYYAAKGKKASLIRSFRVGKGRGDVYFTRAKAKWSSILYSLIFLYLRPPNVFNVHAWIKEEGLKLTFAQAIKVSYCLWRNKIAMWRGVIYFLIHRKN